MRSSRSGYLMAMLAGMAIVGASTGGAVAATSHHRSTLADLSSAADQTTAAAADSAAAGSTAPPASTPGTAAAASNGPSGAVAESVPVASTPTTVSTTGTASTPTTGSTSSPRVKTTTSPTAAKTVSPASTAAKPAAQKYKDGQYSATGSYNSPGGTEKLGVTVTLASDKVTKSDLDLLGGAGLSHSFQTAFASAYSSQVIGKNIDTISLGTVSGSSLTSIGFNEALKKIETEAQK